MDVFLFCGINAVEILGTVSFAVKLRLTKCYLAGRLCAPLIKLCQSSLTPRPHSIESLVEQNTCITFFPEYLVREQFVPPCALFDAILETG